MSDKKPIDKEYLLTQLKNLDSDILEEKYLNQEQIWEGTQEELELVKDELKDDTLIIVNNDKLNVGIPIDMELDAESTNPISNHAVAKNLTAEDGEPFRYAKQDGKRGILVNEGGADTFYPFKSGADIVLIGQYTGNKTINIADYFDEEDTVNNYLIEFVNTAYVRTPYNHESPVSYAERMYCVHTESGTSMSKQLNKSTKQLIISGMVNYANITINGLHDNPSFSQNITYKVYKVG